MTISEAKKYIISELELYSESATFEAAEILIYATQTEREKLLFAGKEKVSRNEFIKIKRIIGKRKKGIPLQYLIGEWEFYALPFKVGKGVLVPRPDTELLVDTALEYLAPFDGKALVLDLCAGTGAVGIAISKNCPKAEVTMVERSKKAFKFLRQNLKINPCNSTAVMEDVFIFRPLKRCDLIVSNPPYIPTDDIKGLSPEVKREPKMALDGGSDGLLFYRKITDRADSLLKKGGRIIFEIGYNQGQAVKEILEAKGFINVEILKDFSGNDRVVLGDLKKYS